MKKLTAILITFILLLGLIGASTYTRAVMDALMVMVHGIYENGSDALVFYDDSEDELAAVATLDIGLTGGDILVGNSSNVAQGRTASGAITFSNTGVVTRYQQTNTYTGDDTMSSAESYGYVHYVTGAGTITLQSVQAGMNFQLRTEAEVTIYIDPSGTEKIRLNGSALGNGNRIVNGADRGDWVQCTYYAATIWDCITSYHESGPAADWTDVGS